MKLHVWILFYNHFYYHYKCNTFYTDSIVVKYECIYPIYIHVPDGIKKVLSYVINDSYNQLHNLNVKIAKMYIKYVVYSPCLALSV
jgi:hypothetical protein